MLTVSSHKIEGPKGVGALWIDQGVVKTRGLSPITLGGGQEGGLRSGTENVSGIAAFAKAAAVAHAELPENAKKISTLRDYICTRLSGIDVQILTPPVRAPHIINIILPKVKSQTMLNFLSSNGISVSSGSACSSNTHHASSALASYGVSDEDSDYSIRVSLSRNNTTDEADFFIEKLAEGLSSLQRVK
jgi:cysteine desulfurase